MKLPPIALEKVRALEPACLTLTIPESYKDENGHMNMRWYLAIFDDAGEVMHERVGLTPEFHRPRGTGTVDMEHHIHYLSEVMPGDTVTVYQRLIAYSAKRLQYQLFMVNDTRRKLAAVFECMNAFLDRTTRRTAPFPPEIAEKISTGVAKDSSLDWAAPVSGSMRV